MTDTETLSRAAVQITRAAPLFDRVVDMLCSGRVSELELRERLDGHFPEFREIYFRLLSKHVGPDLPAVLAALNGELVQTYFKALKTMEPELIGELQRLAQKMALATGSDAGRPSASAERGRVEALP